MAIPMVGWVSYQNVVVTDSDRRTVGDANKRCELIHDHNQRYESKQDVLGKHLKTLGEPRENVFGREEI